MRVRERVNTKGRIEYIRWRGKEYRRYLDSINESDKRYFRSGGSPGTYLHRDVWEHCNGPIPAGYHVHHLDEDPANNAIENLACLSSIEHAARHPREYDLEHLAAIRPLTKAWHASEAGRAWHGEHAKKAYAKREPRAYECKHCGDEFRTRHRGNSRFCSNKCKSAARRASGVDIRGRACQGCGDLFFVDRYAKTKYCSRQCAGRHRSERGSATG